MAEFCEIQANIKLFFEYAKHTWVFVKKNSTLQSLVCIGFNDFSGTHPLSVFLLLSCYCYYPVTVQAAYKSLQLG